MFKYLFILSTIITPATAYDGFTAPAIATGCGVNLTSSNDYRGAPPKNCTFPVVLPKCTILDVMEFSIEGRNGQVMVGASADGVNFIGDTMVIDFGVNLGDITFGFQLTWPSTAVYLRIITISGTPRIDYIEGIGYYSFIYDMPVFAWDSISNADGYRFSYRYEGSSVWVEDRLLGNWDWVWPDEVVTMHVLSWPLLRMANFTPHEVVEVCVRAYNEVGWSPPCPSTLPVPEDVGDNLLGGVCVPSYVLI